MLPDQSGLNLVEQFRSENADLPVLLSSGYSAKQSKWPVIREKRFRFLQKPYSINQLLRTVRDVMS